jgi:hypothetical protein
MPWVSDFDTVTVIVAVLSYFFIQDVGVSIFLKGLLLMLD